MSGYLLSGSCFSRLLITYSIPSNIKESREGLVRIIITWKDITPKLIPLVSLGNSLALAGISRDKMAIGIIRGQVLLSMPEITSIFKNIPELPE